MNRSKRSIRPFRKGLRRNEVVDILVLLPNPSDDPAKIKTMNEKLDNNISSQQVSENRLDRKWIVQAAVLIAIVLVGIASRFWLVDMPNFKPIAALVLFGAFFFNRSWVAIAALVLIMAISDFKLGVYDWKLAVCVYVSLGLAAAMGCWIKRSIESGSQRRLGWKQAGRFAIASLAMSTAFFVLTNGAVYLMGQWYPSTWSGLANCYSAGVPFYRATLMGDLFFTGVLVGGYGAFETIQLWLAGRVSKRSLAFNA